MHSKHHELIVAGSAHHWARLVFIRAYWRSDPLIAAAQRHMGPLPRIPSIGLGFWFGHVLAPYAVE